MPAHDPPASQRLTRFINARLLLPDGTLSLPSPLTIDSESGLIVPSAPISAVARYDTVDLKGLILSPGMIDLQINGAFGVDLSDWRGDTDDYERGLRRMSEGLVKMGVTSYVPTIITREVYRSVLPLLSSSREALEPDGQADRIVRAIPLGFHVEGPFIHPDKVGCHPKDKLVALPRGMDDLEVVYGAEAVSRKPPHGREPIRIITLAPEVPGILKIIPELASRRFVVSIGHTNASPEDATQAVSAGATLITHLFNAMPPLRLLGLPLCPVNQVTSHSSFAGNVHSTLPSSVTELSKAISKAPAPAEAQQHHDDHLPLQMGTSRTSPSATTDKRLPRTPISDKIPPMLSAAKGLAARPFFSIIADGVHVHPQAVSMAYHSHPTGCILVSDAMPMMDPALPDGTYSWRDGVIEKKGESIVLAGTDTRAGSILPLPHAVRNLARFAGIPLSQAILCATTHPARVVGGWVEHAKGDLQAGSDADLCVWDEDGEVRGVWKGGREVWRTF